MKKKIDITPDTTILPKLGKSGYKNQEAIAELIENSIDAAIPSETLTVEVIMNEKKIVVKDDGQGMDEETAINALRLAHSMKKNKLGEFGLGLKTACTALGRTFRVETTKKGIPERYIIEYDEDKWKEKNSWEHTLKVEEAPVNEHGTTVEITKLRFNYYPMMSTTYKDAFSMRFGSFIENKEVKIKVNRKFCEPFKFKLTEEGKHKFEIPTDDGHVIHGWWGLLATRSVKGGYGFNLFKGDRLIKTFQQIGFNPHPEVARIFGEIHLDHVPVTHNKREFITESREYKLFEEAIKRYVEKEELTKKSREYGRKSRSVRLERKIKDEIQRLFSSKGIIPIAGDRIERPALILELIDTETDYPHYEIEIDGEKIKVVLSLQKFGEDRDWIYDQVKKDEIHIFINEESNLFENNELPGCVKIGVSEAIAKYLINKQNRREDVLTLRDNIMRGLNIAIKTQIEKEKMLEKKKRLEKEIAALKADLENE